MASIRYRVTKTLAELRFNPRITRSRKYSSVENPTQEATGASFPYTPLQNEEIRLLRRLPNGNHHAEAEQRPKFSGQATTESLLLQAKSEEPNLQYTLETVSLNANPKYKALSYTWGKWDLVKGISINGVTILVTENLFIALQHLSCEDTLWIDAICINQFDDAEKSVQVQQMRRIYEAAESVLVFLGSEADDSDKLMDCFERMGSIAVEVGIAGFHRAKLVHVSKTANDQFSRENLPKLERCYKIMDRWFYDEFPVQAYLKFLGRPWWYRVWVVQEVSVAKEVVFICGKKRLRSECIQNADNVLFLYTATANFSHLRRHNEDEAGRKHDITKKVLNASSAMSLMVSLRSYYQRTSQRRDEERTLCDLLHETAIADDPSTKRRASDDRDMIFGLLGLAGDRDKLNIRIDYNATAEDVFINTSKAILSKLDLSILAFQARPPSTRTELPSWVCDWAANVCLPFGDGTNTDRPFRASGTSIAKLSFPDHHDQKILCIEGFRVGKVSRVGFASPSGSAKSLDDEAAQADEFISSAECLFTGHTEEGISRTLLGDYEVFEQDGGVPKARRATPRSLHDYHEKKKFLAFRREKLEINEEGKLGYTPERMQHINDFAKQFSEFSVLNGSSYYWAFLKSSLQRRPFALYEGYIGLGPFETSADDIVCIFLGGQLPFVLRPIGAGLYRLLGEAYVHNAMDGQLMDTNPEMETFEIC